MNDQTLDKDIIPKITKKQWLTSILAIITAMTALMGVDLYLPAMTDMATHFHTTKNHLQLTITIYLVSMAIAAFFYGPLSDKIGRKPTLIIGMLTGLIGCLIILFSTSIHMVIIGRLIQGLGASSGICIATSILMDVVPNTKQRAIMSSYLSMVIALSPLTAPTIGGYLTQNYGWRACFELLATLFGLLASIYIIFFKETIKTKNPNALKPKHFINNYSLLIKNRVFLLTGGTGYIGSVTAKEILKSGARLILTTTKEKNLRKFKSSLNSSFKKRCKIFVVDLNRDEEIDYLIKQIKNEGYFGVPKLYKILEMRYLGQNYGVDITLPENITNFNKNTIKKIFDLFSLEHKKLYGYDLPNEIIEIVNFHISCIGITKKFKPERLKNIKSKTKPEKRKIYFEKKGFLDCNVFLRDDLTNNQKITGPCVIEENNSVTLLHPNQKTIVDEYGNLIISLN